MRPPALSNSGCRRGPRPDELRAPRAVRRARIPLWAEVGSRAPRAGEGAGGEKKGKEASPPQLGPQLHSGTALEPVLTELGVGTNMQGPSATPPPPR